MAAQSKTKALEDKLNYVCDRVSSLNDEIAVLKSQFTVLVQRLEEDMTRVVNRVKSVKK